MKIKKNIGIIGAGSRAFSLGANIIKSGCKLRITALCDKYPKRMKETEEALENITAQDDKNLDIKLYADYKELIDNGDLDLIMITAPQYFHEEPFKYALDKDKLVFCEKPLAHSMESIENMYNAWNELGGKNAMIGFTRRYENSWRRAKEVIDSGRIGNVKMILLRSIIPFDSYFHKWFSQKEYSGGVLNEKCAHHFDVLNWFAGAKPEMISAMGNRIVYTPKENYPKWCKDCNRDCNYRFSYKEELEKQKNHPRPVRFNTAVDSEDVLLAKDKCVYSPEIDTVDHAIVNVGYETGVKAQLFLSIFGYRTHDQETLEVVGDSGKLLLERHSGTIKVDYNFGKENMVIDARDENHETVGHCGADLVIVKTIDDFANKGSKPPADVYDGYLASKMSFLATESCETGKVYKI